MTEEEEFEFRLRYEQEEPTPTGWKEYEPLAADKAANIAGHPASRAAIGASSLITGPLQLGANIGDKIAEWTGEEDPWVGDYVNQKIKSLHDLKEKGRKAKGSEGFDWWEMAGLAGSPINLLKTGVVKAPRLAPSGEKVAKALSTKMFEGGKAGALYGSGMPVVDGGDNFFTQKGAQTAIGAGVGGAVPPVVASGKLVGSIADDVTRPLAFRNTPGNWYSKTGALPGIVKDTKDYMIEAAGTGRQKIVDALQKAKSGQTARQVLAQESRKGDVVGSPFIKLEDDISKRVATSDVAKSKYAQQEAQRAADIGGIKGTPQAMSAAKKARTDATKPLYKAVEDSTARVDTASVLGRVDDILAKNKNETSITTPLAAIKKKLSPGGEPETNPQALYSLSKELKAMMSKTTTTGQKEYNVKVLDEIKGLLDDQIGKAESAFKTAQSTYKTLSEPINQMQVGGELEKALVNAKQRESAAPFLTAMREAPRTIKRSTGFNRYDKLDDVLKPEQTQAANKVQDQLLTEETAKAISAKTRSAYPALTEEAKLQIAPMLERNVMIANALMRRVARNVTPDYEKVAWDILKNPNKMADLLKKSPEKAKSVMEYMKRMSILAPTGVATQGVNQ